MMIHIELLLLCFLSAASVVASFQVIPSRNPLLATSPTKLHSKKDEDESADLQRAFPVGSFVEFEEKSRLHIGTISTSEHKSNGAARYKVTDADGKMYSISHKDIRFSLNAPNSPNAAAKLFDEFCTAQGMSDEQIQKKLDISPELLEMAWEESNENEGESTNLTPSRLVELVHAHAASGIEKYMAWRMLQTESAHIFFKEIKDHGRIVSFKAKTRKAVEAAKVAFCMNHEDSELCFV